jgi:hypothetical protein
VFTHGIDGVFVVVSIGMLGAGVADLGRLAATPVTPMNTLTFVSILSPATVYSCA